ncbi:BTAD domain-containing putative transcriptional regulator [Polymorphospora sp. NPDC051019]|uniref:AfsR/SARP family transcriptional regulator n=1 Tax=Polymorphospora sp. NPDC051019 TaxID=3155725 RepID=UPI003437513C
MDLPDGGWIPTPTAEAITAAAVLVWFRRRRRYTPHPAGTRHDADNDLAALPPTVAAVQAAQTTQPSHQLEARPAAAPEPVHPAALPPGLLTLTGPGAADAIRGLIVTATISAGQRQIVTTADDLAHLLGPDSSGRAWHGIAGLIVTATTADAITTATTPHHARPTDTGGRLATSPLLIIASTASISNLSDHLTALSTRTIGPVTTVVLGTTHHGGTWHVAADGHTTTNDRRRMCVLGPTPAADLLTLARHAHPAAAPTPVHPRHEKARLRIQVLGPLQVTIDDTPVSVRRTAAWQTLVYLAIHPDGATTEELAEAIWPDLRLHAVTNRIYATISELRKTLHTAAGTPVVERVTDRYRLHPDTSVDLWQLQATIAAASRAITSDARHHALHAVLEQPPGELATGQPWPWLVPHREAIRRQIIDAHTTMAAGKPPPEALRLLEQAITVDPLNEHLHLQAVQALTATGQHAAAADLLDTYRQRITELGLPPGDEL